MPFLKGDQPTPPNPIQTAAAQTGTNVSTGVANAFLNNVNQQTPQGNLSYNVTGQYDWTDPSTGSTYSIPRFTAEQTYATPLQQQTAGETEATRYNLAALGTKESQQLSNYLTNTNFNPLNSAPPGGAAGYLAPVGDPTYTYNQINPLTNLNQYGQLGGIANNLSQFGQLGGIMNSYGDNAGVLQDRSNIENSLFQRVQPQNDRDLANLQAHLADQGIKYGSPAYQAAMDNYNRGINDQRLAITAQGGQEQALQQQILQNQAQFANQAQNQQYQQLSGQADLYNTAQQQNYQQMLGQTNLYNTAAQQFNQQGATAASFYNNAQQQELAKQAQVYDAMQQQRNQYLTEQYASRNQPINEVTSLLSGSQLQQPNFVNTGQNRIATTDIGGLINNQFNQNLDLYKTNANNVSQILGGLFSAAGSLGGAAISDEREKEDVHKIGSVLTAVPQKLAELPIYKYKYKNNDPDSAEHTGPMAQDVEKIDPAAVGHDRDGVKYINARRVLGGIMRAA